MSAALRRPACRVVQATHRGLDSQFWSARDLTAANFKINSSSGANQGYWWLAIGH